MNPYIIKKAQPHHAEIANYPWLATYPNAIKATAQVTYDDTALHVKLFAYETNLRMETKNPNEMVCEDSCLEFFLNPMPAASEKYINFEFNPKGNYWLSIGEGRGQRTCMEFSSFPYDFNISPEIHEDSWEINFSIPYVFIREFYPEFTVSPSHEMRGNFYKCGDCTDHIHFGSWNLVQTENPDFHQPEYFGKLIFE